MSEENEGTPSVEVSGWDDDEGLFTNTLDASSNSVFISSFNGVCVGDMMGDVVRCGLNDGIRASNPV